MSKEISPKEFSRMMPHMPKDLKIPCAILYKMEGCGWCNKMEADWDEVGEKVGFMNVYHFGIDSNKDNVQHWTKIENSLETEIEGFPAVMFYKPDGRCILHTGYSTSDETIKKMIKFCEN
jgi:hypothetical protein